MAVPTKKKQKKGGKLIKTVLWILLIGAIFNGISDGALMDDLNRLMGRDQIQSSGGDVPGDPDGDPDPDSGDPDGGENTGNQTGEGNQTGNQSGNQSGGGTQTSGSKATYGSGSKPNLPSSLKNNVFLNTKDQGISATFTGKVLITTVFVSDKKTDWTKSEMNAIKKGHQAMTDVINAEAKKWGVELELTLEYRTASVTQDLATASHNDWYKNALKSAGLTETASTDLEKDRKVKEAPIFFYLDLTGRAFASSSLSKSNRPEYAVFYSGDSGAANYRHELYHLFGAKDFYYPDAIESLGKQYFSDSVMLTAGKNAATDTLTAYLIGWTDTLSADAKAFLEATNWVTTDYLKEEHDKETYTGYVTDWKMGAATYTGYLEDGVQQGQGTMVWDNGNRYTGGWDYGQMHGQGTFTWASGASYTGSFHKGLRTGKGKYTFASGAWYEGGFKDNKFHGTGTYRWTNGDTYVGTWTDDVRTGKGKYTWKDGSWYEGDFVEGKFHGTGTRVYSNGARYEGQWQNSKCHGQGKLTYANGAWYEGAWNAGKMQGQGTMVYSNGDKYVGQWQNDKRQGQGTYYFANGAAPKSGQWDDNKFVG